MKKPIKVLMVDDHPIILTGYQLSIENIDLPNDINIDTTSSIDEGFDLITKARNNPYDIIFLDISMPPSKNWNFLDGEDFGIEIKKRFPKAKFIILTMLNSNYRIHGILKNLNPNVFMIKSEITHKNLQEAFIKTIKGDYYHCEITRNIVRKRIKDNINIDSLDRKILHHLSLGEKMKNLPELLPLSMPSIERRKRKLKNILDIYDGSDKLLLSKAKENGLI